MDLKIKDTKEKKKMKRENKDNNVIITIYIESPAVPRRPPDCWKSLRTAFPPRPKRGCNRRAELLAYSNQLRGRNMKESEVLPTKRRRVSKGKIKKLIMDSNSKSCAWFPSRTLTARVWGYEKIEEEEQSIKDARMDLHKQPDWKAQLSNSLKGLSSKMKCTKLDDCNRHALRKIKRRPPQGHV